MYRAGNRTVGDCHLIPQHEFVFYPNGTRSCSHVLRYENLEVDLAEFLRRSNISVLHGLPRLPRRNNATRVCSRPLSPDTLVLVKEIYRRDFEMFYPLY